jgi:hypothetical protein
MTKLSHGVWRRALSCALAYALALQGFVFVLDSGGPAVAAPDPIFASFELCHHSGVTLPNAPAPAPLGEHCPFCLAGAVLVPCPACTPQHGKLLLGNAMWPLARPRLIALFINKSAWPRGPPAAA